MPLVNENGNGTNPASILTWYKTFKLFLGRLTAAATHENQRAEMTVSGTNCCCCEAASDIQRLRRAAHINRPIANTAFSPAASALLSTSHLFNVIIVGAFAKLRKKRDCHICHVRPHA
jgi:hypothetical protein